MNINEIITEMNAGGTITTAEYNYWVENYDAAMHPWTDPLANYTISDEDEYIPIDDGSWYGR